MIVIVIWNKWWFDKRQTSHYTHTHGETGALLLLGSTILNLPDFKAIQLL